MTELLAQLAPLAVELAAAALLALGSFAAARLATWLRLCNDAAVRGYLQDAIERAVDWAEARMVAALAGQPPTAADWRRAVEDAAGYLGERVPDALAHFGITPEAVRRLVEARLAPRR
jgi:hypothetical protein